MCGKGGGKGWQMEQKEEEAEMVPHFPAKGSGGDASRLSWGTEQKERDVTVRGLESEILRTEEGVAFDDLCFDLQYGGPMKPIVDLGE